MMLRKSRGLCAVEVRGAGEHRLDCVLALQPDNLNSCQLNQLSGLPLGTTPEETEAMAERRTPGEGAKSCECRSQAQLSADAGVWPATQLRESCTGHLGVDAIPALEVQEQSHTETREQWLTTAGGQRWQLVTASRVLRGSTAQMNVQAEAIQSDLNN